MMHFVIPLLIIGLSSFPMWSEAFASTNASEAGASSNKKAKQTVVVDNKKLTQRQKQDLKKKVREKKCRVAIDSKTKKKYYICN